MKAYLLSGVLATALTFNPIGVFAQSAQPKSGAAEKVKKGWPYPEPAQRGATGFSPDYSRYSGSSEQWDIYVNILWRKTGSRTKPEISYYNEELSQFLASLSSDDRARFNAANQLPLLMEQIRASAFVLPYREGTTGCLSLHGQARQ
jgi:hypothetical protein